MSAANALTALVLVGMVLGLCWMARSLGRLGAKRLLDHAADRVELQRWRASCAVHDRWLAEFPAIAAVLANVRAQAEGRELSRSANDDGPWATGALRERLRAGVFAEELLRPLARKVVADAFKNDNGLRAWIHGAASGLCTGDVLADFTALQKASKAGPEMVLPAEASCGGTIQTAKGHYFDFLAPERSVFDVEVLASALSKLCRFTGHCSRFYSVAQHQVLVSYAVPEEDAFEALHHDDEEAFLNDIAKPLKELLPDYQRLEKRVRPVIVAKFGLAPELPASVKHGDRVLLATEQRELMPPEWHEVEWDVDGKPTRYVQATERHPWWTLKGITPLEGPIHTWTPAQAEREYLKRHYELLALREIHAEKARAA